jgi:hypothetical protein
MFSFLVLGVQGLPVAFGASFAIYVVMMTLCGKGNQHVVRSLLCEPGLVG